MYGPSDISLSIADLFHRAVVVMREDTKARRLAFYAALCVLKAAWRVRFLANEFRPDKELVRTVPDSCDTDRRVNLVDGCHLSSLPGLPPSRNADIASAFSGPMRSCTNLRTSRN